VWGGGSPYFFYSNRFIVALLAREHPLTPRTAFFFTCTAFPPQPHEKGPSPFSCELGYFSRVIRAAFFPGFFSLHRCCMLKFHYNPPPWLLTTTLVLQIPCVTQWGLLFGVAGSPTREQKTPRRTPVRLPRGALPFPLWAFPTVGCPRLTTMICPWKWSSNPPWSTDTNESLSSPECNNPPFTTQFPVSFFF